MSAIGAVGAVGATPPISPSLLTFASPTQLDALARIASTPNVTAQQLALALGLDVTQIAGQVEMHLSQLRRLLLSAGFRVPAPTAVDASGASATGDAMANPAVPGAAAEPSGAAATPKGPGTAAVTAPPSPPTASHVPTPAVGAPDHARPFVPGAPVAPGSAPVAGAAAGGVGATETGAVQGGGGAAVPAPARSAYVQTARLAAADPTASAPLAPPALHAHGALRVGSGDTAVLVLVEEGAAPGSGHGLAPALLTAGTPRGAVVVASMGLDPAPATAATAATAAAAGATAVDSTAGPAAGGAAGPAAGGAAGAAAGAGSMSGSSGQPPAGVPTAGVPQGSPRSWSQVAAPTAPGVSSTAAQVPIGATPPPVPLQQVAADPIVGLRSWALVDLAVPPLPHADVDAAAKIAAPTVAPLLLDGGSGPAGQLEAADVLARAAGRPVDVVADARTAAAAIEMALRDPSKVRRLVLDLSGFFAGGAAAAAAVDDVLASGAVRATDPGRLAELLAAAGTWGPPKEERRSRKAPDKGGGRRNLAEHLFAALFSMRIADQAEQLEVPVTLIGPQDEHVRLLLERAAEYLADATVIASSRPEVVVLEIIRGE